MTIKEVTRHAVAEQRIEQALEDMWGRAFGRWHDMRYGDMPLRRGLRELGEELADHVAARTVPDPALRTPDSRTALITAAECAMGVLSLACFPDGDFSVSLPLVMETLSSEELDYEETGEPTNPVTSARTWTEAFAWCVISGLIWDRNRVIGPLLREDYAPAIGDGVPYSKRRSVSDPADIAEMDALCGYLTVVQGHYPGVLAGPVPLGKPDTAERARTAEQFDTAGTLTPDQRLLRVLLDDDQAAFEQALQERLVAHRESVGSDPAARSLLPVGAATLASLACQAHGWELGTRSAYLPETLVSVAQQ
ncbi:immunity protein 49 of polymorphic toxin system [Streptomyces sp. 840.1]|uniref:immunity 49 family protein n=1 Tax=Streptomyces sp. 840.1 TaxID=2485152 RepID=UPI000FB47D05|nr:immunity 49 family protein [Streptomyces sp. 840.1]ROQ68508.1 immunity protein 49 of polymorphic toxin system [Streptomyces sp. 840.1]